MNMETGAKFAVNTYECQQVSGVQPECMVPLWQEEPQRSLD